MLNFGSLAAEICWRVWGTLTNFNGFRVLAALLHGTLVVGVSQTAAGRPSRWALAHILAYDGTTRCNNLMGWATDGSNSDIKKFLKDFYFNTEPRLKIFKTF